jgi:hypothetical protein
MLPVLRASGGRCRRARVTQRGELRFDGVQPRRVGRHVRKFDVVVACPVTDPASFLVARCGLKLSSTIAIRADVGYEQISAERQELAAAFALGDVPVEPVEVQVVRGEEVPHAVRPGERRASATPRCLSGSGAQRPLSEPLSEFSVLPHTRRSEQPRCPSTAEGIVRARAATNSSATTCRRAPFTTARPDGRYRNCRHGKPADRQRRPEQQLDAAGDLPAWARTRRRLSTGQITARASRALQRVRDARVTSTTRS